jgi:hypothetical protein
MKVKLSTVSNKAMAEPAFFKSLRSDPDRALAASKMELSSADYKRLRAILALEGKNVTIDLSSLMAMARRGSASTVPRTLTWLGLWDVGTPASKLPL